MASGRRCDDRDQGPDPGQPTGHAVSDRAAYRLRNVIERSFCKLKDWRAVATRYDKTARNYLSGICLIVAVTNWLNESKP